MSRGDRIPRLPGGDHGVQVPEDRRRDDGLRLGGREPVLIPAGQVLVAGPVDRIAALGSPDRPPCRQPQPRPSLPGEPGPAGETARQLFPGRQPGVLNQRAGGGEPAGVEIIVKKGAAGQVTAAVLLYRAVT